MTYSSPPTKTKVLRVLFLLQLLCRSKHVNNTKHPFFLKITLWKSSYHTHQFSHFILHIISLPQPSFRSCTSSHCREQQRDPSPHRWSPQAAMLQEHSEAAWPSFTASVSPDSLRAGAATSCLPSLGLHHPRGASELPTSPAPQSQWRWVPITGSDAH